MLILADAIHDVLLSSNRHQTTNPLPHAYASESMSCARRVSLRMLDTGHDFKPDIRLSLSGFVGNKLHDLIQEALERHYSDVVPELKWDADLVTGRADGVYRSYKDLVVVEIKTMNSFAYQRNTKKGKPTPEHTTQASLSALVLNASKIHMIYVNRNLSMRDEAMVDWVMDADLGFAEVEFDHLAHIAHQVRQGVVMDREYQGEIIDDPMDRHYNWPCGFCPFRITCVDLGEGEFPASEVLPKLAGGLDALPVI